MFSHLYEEAVNKGLPSGLSNPRWDFLIKTIYNNIAQLSLCGAGRTADLSTAGWVTVFWLHLVGLGKNRRWICLSVEQPGIALPLPDSLPLNINHLLKHLCFVPKAKGGQTERREEKGRKGEGREREEGSLQLRFIHSTNICEESLVAGALPKTHSLSAEGDGISILRGSQSGRGDTPANTKRRGKISPALSLAFYLASPLTRGGWMGEMEEEIRDLKVSRVFVPRAVV